MDIRIKKKFVERDEDLENLLNKGALWAVTYGDLMSYLMLFFLLMFSFAVSYGGLDFLTSLSQVQEVFGGEQNLELLAKKQQEEKEKRLADEVQKKLAASGMQQYTKVDITEEKVRITLREPILFDIGGTDLKPTAKTVLNEVASFLKTLPNDVTIEGHTDNLPIPKKSRLRSNWILSMERAYGVLQFFIDSAGLPPQRLACVGYGEFRPVNGNNTPEGRALNRRIEITIVRSK